MAVLDSVPGIQVSVVSNGNTLQEYADEDEFKHKKFSAPEVRTSTTYIECVSDAEFGIKFEVNPDFVKTKVHSHLSFWGIVDGTAIGGCQSVQASGNWNHTLDVCIRRISQDEVTQSKLKFCALKKVDDAESSRVKEDVSRAADLGEIIVHVHRSTELPEMEYGMNGAIKAGINEISEKALKGQAKSHGVAFGPEQRTKQAQRKKVGYPEGYDTPLAIFRFKYRSCEALQAEMIIPRSETPDLVMGPLNPRNGEETDQQRLARLKQEIEDIKSNVKHEGGDNTSARRKRGASTLDSGRAYKTSKSHDGLVTVDLTDD